MELVDGADLMDVIRAGTMTQEMALTLLPQICDALQFAHENGIVHRDIKPSNIMLTRDGRVKMCDFGLAKRYDADSGFRTQTGTGMGTPDYAAPEQFDPSAQIDHRADIYALGVMIYQMITGQLPRGVWKAPSLRSECAPQWDSIVSRAMQSDPADRYQQASEVKTDVSSIAADRAASLAYPSDDALRHSALPKSRAPLLFGIVGLAAVIALGAFFGLRPESSHVSSDGGNVAGMTLTDHALASAAIPASPAAQGIVRTTQGRLSPSTEPWVNALTDPSGLGLGDSPGAKVTPQGLLMPGPGSVLLKQEPNRDGAIRMLASLDPEGKGVGFRGRFSTTDGTFYSAGINAEGEVTLSSFNNKTKAQRTLRAFPLPAPLTAGQDYELELRIIGDRLITKFNGKLLGEVTDSTFKVGQFCIAVSSESPPLVKALEYLNLDGAKADANIASSEPAAIKLWDSAEKLSKSRGIRWEDEAMRLDQAGPSSVDRHKSCNIR